MPCQMSIELALQRSAAWDRYKLHAYRENDPAAVALEAESLSQEIAAITALLVKGSGNREKLLVDRLQLYQRMVHFRAFG